MDMRARKALGCFVLLAYLAIYVLLAGVAGVWVHESAPAALALAYFLIAGIVWIFPLRPLFRWMNAGRA